MDRSAYLVALLLLSACSEKVATNNQPTMSHYEQALDAENKSIMAAYRNNAPPFNKLPPVPIAIVCMGENTNCEENSFEMIKNWPLAWAGDYQGQRNVAYILDNQSPGIVLNQIQGCAWRIVIQTSGHTELVDGDFSNYNLECSKLNAGQFSAAKEVARGIFKKVKGAIMPDLPNPISP